MTLLFTLNILVHFKKERNINFDCEYGKNTKLCLSEKDGSLSLTLLKKKKMDKQIQLKRCRERKKTVMELG